MLQKEPPFENKASKMFKYYIQDPNCHKVEVKGPPVYHTATCDDMKHATGIIDVTSTYSLVGLRVV